MATEVRPDDRALRFGAAGARAGPDEAHDLDVLVLGRTANVRYVTGTPTLWTAGTSSFGPACMLVRSTGSIHLLSTLGRGDSRGHPQGEPVRPHLEPDEHDRGAAARRGHRGGAPGWATDALSPTFAQVLPVAFPAAELVDGEVAMRAARRIKAAEELAVLREAVAVAETSLAKAVAELRPGATEKELAGVLLEAAAAGGATTPGGPGRRGCHQPRAPLAAGGR